MRLTLLVMDLLVAAVHGVAAAPPIDPIENDFSPMLFLFFIIGVCIALVVLVGIVAAGILIAASACFLVGAGVVSSSAIVGLLRGRFSSGLRAMHYQLCAVAAAPAGVGALWLVAHLWELQFHTRDIVLLGILAGIGSGVLLAFVLDRLGKAISRSLVGKWHGEGALQKPVLDKGPEGHERLETLR